MERGGTVGASISCTKLRHGSERRSSALVPDVEGNLSQDKGVAERRELNKNYKYRKVQNAQGQQDTLSKTTTRLNNANMLIFNRIFLTDLFLIIIMPH